MGYIADKTFGDAINKSGFLLEISDYKLQ